MTKAGHGLAWKLCLFLAFCYWIDARRPEILAAETLAADPEGTDD